MTRVTKTFEDLMDLARCYGVENNALFIAAAQQYELQQMAIRMMREEIEKGELTTTKTYLKGTENAYANPLIKELPKHSDSANKTLSVMLDIIQKLGTKEPAGDKLGDFLAG